MRMKKWILAGAAAMSMLLASCTKEPEPLLIDDREIFGTADAQETIELTKDAESGEESEESLPQKEPAAVTYDCDPTMTNFRNMLIYYDATRTFASDENYIYYADKANSGGVVDRILHRVDRETGKDEILCDDPECRHLNEKCKAFLCQGNLSGFQLYGGQLWYCWTMGASNGTTLHIMHHDLNGGRRQLYASFEYREDTGNMSFWPVDPQCFFHRGKLYMAVRNLTFKNAATEERQSYSTYSGFFKLLSFEMDSPEDVPVDALSEKDIAPEVYNVFEESFEGELMPVLRVIPYEDEIYFATSYQTPQDPSAAIQDWVYERKTALYRMNTADEKPELLLETEASLRDLWVNAEGIRMCLTRANDDGTDSILLVSFTPGQAEAEDICEITDVYDICLGGNMLIMRLPIGENSDPDAEDSELKDEGRYHYGVYDLSGKELQDITFRMTDPRYDIESLAPAVHGSLIYADEEALYFTWAQGLIKVPYVDAEPWYYGLSE